MKASELRRIVIFGGSGSGKTVLAMQLGKILHRETIHIDDLSHGPNWAELPRTQLIDRVRRRIRNDDWIIDGNYSAVRPYVLVRCTVVIIIHIPLIVVLTQLIFRIIGRKLNLKMIKVTPLPLEVQKSGSKENFAEAFYILTKSALRFHFNRYYRIRKEIKAMSKPPKLVILKSNGQKLHFLKAVQMITQTVPDI